MKVEPQGNEKSPDYGPIDSTNVEKKTGRSDGFDEPLAREIGPGHLEAVPEMGAIGEGGLGPNTQAPIDGPDSYRR